MAYLVKGGREGGADEQKSDDAEEETNGDVEGPKTHHLLVGREDEPNRQAEAHQIEAGQHQIDHCLRDECTLD